MAPAPAPFLLKAFIKAFKSPSVLPFALYLSVSFANQLLEIPLLRLLENAICNRHYRSIRDDSLPVFIDVDEILCKIPAVQDQLSDVVGWKIFSDAIPGYLYIHVWRRDMSPKSLTGLLSAISNGHVAEKHGRQWAIRLHKIVLIVSQIKSPCVPVKIKRVN